MHGCKDILTPNLHALSRATFHDTGKRSGPDQMAGAAA
jgi:hypothetical protein